MSLLTYAKYHANIQTHRPIPTEMGSAWRFTTPLIQTDDHGRLSSILAIISFGAILTCMILLWRDEKYS